MLAPRHGQSYRYYHPLVRSSRGQPGARISRGIPTAADGVCRGGCLWTDEYRRHLLRQGFPRTLRLDVSRHRLLGRDPMGAQNADGTSRRFTVALQGVVRVARRQFNRRQFIDHAGLAARTGRDAGRIERRNVVHPSQSASAGRLHDAGHGGGCDDGGSRTVSRCRGRAGTGRNSPRHEYHDANARSRGDHQRRRAGVAGQCHPLRWRRPGRPGCHSRDLYPRL